MTPMAQTRSDCSTQPSAFVLPHLLNGLVLKEHMDLWVHVGAFWLQPHIHPNLDKFSRNATSFSNGA